jgi:hypothetical protein
VHTDGLCSGTTKGGGLRVEEFQVDHGIFSTPSLHLEIENTIEIGKILTKEAAY